MPHKAAASGRPVVRRRTYANLGEVQAVDLRDLEGLDDVLEALEANVTLPRKDSALAEELNLKPKRGVLLAGPARGRRQSAERSRIG